MPDALIPESGTVRRMTVTQPHRLPVRVTLAHECELVTAGLAVLMAPHASRVVVVSSPGGIPAKDVDLTLHDTLAGVHDLPGLPAPPIAHDGRLVTWTWNARPQLVQLALAHGASGVLSKELSAARLLAAFESIHRGRQVVDLGDRPPTVGVSAEHGILTPREGEVISMITQGMTNQAIAQQACISINSLKSYIRAAYRKMGVESRSQAVLWGVRHGYVGSTVIDEDAGISA
ncbi:MAG: regulatory protein LuxR [Nocardioides sp.]|nr:regulatory protein LuxR [Nocardioides sp.]